jgi:hypothetical protein
MRGEGVTPLILHLGTRWGVFSFISWLLYVHGTLNRQLGGPKLWRSHSTDYANPQSIFGAPGLME